MSDTLNIISPDPDPVPVPPLGGRTGAASAADAIKTEAKKKRPRRKPAAPVPPIEPAKPKWDPAKRDAIYTFCKSMAGGFLDGFDKDAKKYTAQIDPDFSFGLHPAEEKVLDVLGPKCIETLPPDLDIPPWVLWASLLGFGGIMFASRLPMLAAVRKAKLAENAAKKNTEEVKTE